MRPKLLSAVSPMKLLIILFIFLLLIAIAGCKSKETSNKDFSDYYSNASAVSEVPFILLANDSNQETGIYLTYNVETKQIENTANILAVTDRGFTYQWDGTDKLFISNNAAAPLNNTFTVDSFDDYYTKILTTDNITYKVSTIDDQLVLEKIVADKTTEKINLLENHTEFQNPTPLLIYKDGVNVNILVHYYHPGKIADNEMISGLVVVSKNEQQIKLKDINMNNICCVNPNVGATLVGDHYYVNSFGSISQVSMPDNRLEESDINNVTEDFKNELQLKYKYYEFGGLPQIGKYGNLLLVSYGLSSSSESQFCVWGIHSDKVIFKLYFNNGDVFNDADEKIFSIKGTIDKILLPNDLIRADTIFAPHVDYMVYNSIKELSDVSTVIIKGQVIKVHVPAIIRLAVFPNGTTLEDVFTVSDVRVMETLKGDMQPGEIIQVKQRGGLYEGKMYTPDAPELFTQNMRGIFFLETYEGSPAACINPTQGFLKIVDGVIEVHDSGQKPVTAEKQKALAASGIVSVIPEFFDGADTEHLMELIKDVN